MARAVLFQGLPEHVREDAPWFVLDAMARRIDAMIGEGIPAGEIVRRAHEMSLDSTRGRHMKALAAIRSSLRADLLAEAAEASRDALRAVQPAVDLPMTRGDVLLALHDALSPPVAEENPITEEGEGNGGHGPLCAVHGDARRLEDGSCLPCSLKGRKPNSRPMTPAHRR